MRRREAICTMLSAAVYAGFGCSGGGSGKRRIAVVPKGTSHDFWQSVHFGAEKAAKEFGVQIEWNGPPDEKENVEQRKIVETFIGDQVDGICLAPINRTAAGQLITAAKRQGIPTVIFDSGVNEDAQKEIVSYVATQNLEGGRMAGRRLAEVMGEEGGVILLRYQAGSESTEQREAGFLEEIGKHPKMKVLSDNIRVDSSVGEARSKSETLLEKFGDQVKGVFTVCEPNNKGMYAALNSMIDAGKFQAGDVKFVAFDPDPRMIEGLQNGLVQGVVLQDPVNMGYLSVKTIVEHLDGNEVEKRIGTGEALATRENMKDEDVAKLLDPPKFSG